MTMTLVNNNHFGNVASGTLSFSATNTLLLGTQSTSGFSYLSSVTLTNVVWTNIFQYTPNTRRMEFWLGVVVGTAGTSLTISNAVGGFFVLEISGLPLTATSVTGNFGTSVNPATASITPTATNEAMMIASVARANTFSSGPTNSFVDVSSSTGSARMATRDVASASGSYSTDWTFTGSLDWATGIVLFEQTGGGGGATSWGPDLSDQLNRLVVSHP